MNDIIDLLKELMNAEKLAHLVTLYGGLYLVAFIIFAETGLFVGFFLPGDSLLFVTVFQIIMPLFCGQTNNLQHCQ